ncbi:capsule biosynthesis protein [Methylobacterium gnaphalii]|uniref:Capsular polysaccharide export protein n=1 Tax=Methylobacterium gnaphalii TaxID=1010610 RepID=A0A512JRT2_9HYPH|nr:capsular biosynthesis protein [Methylobacterium gnaphalii]GEP12674.1 capsular polysaccharide export protein [Methylobacterium gnaphalii]GLS51697.1 capsular polysaccharide export protein [Methylobacterium gnaphalii]
MAQLRPITARSPIATFLFLQGIASPFFSDLGRALRERGHKVRRINFSSGDWLFWRGESDNYRGTSERWPAYLEAYIREHAVTDLVLFGDCRPYHVAAIEAAKPLGVRVHVFEEGYIRPNWITCEHGGVNGSSTLPKTAAEIRAIARRLPQQGRAMPLTGDMARRSIWDIAYNIANIGFPYLYPGFRSHRPNHIAAEYGGWIKKFMRRGRTRRHAADVNRIYSAIQADYFLLPLQLDSDYQIRVHSPFLGVEGFMDRVIASFAKYVRQQPEAQTRLLVKLHPLDSGIMNWRKRARQSARRHGVNDRIDFIDGGDLQALIDGSRGVVLVNSTVGMLALERGRPTLATGVAIYDVPGLTHQGDIDSFWHEPTPPDMALMADFRRVVMHRTQINGGYFSKPAIARAVAGAVPRLEAVLPPASLALARSIREPAAESGNLSPAY